QRADEVVDGTAEVWVIEDVEEFRSEIETHLLREVKSALYPEIHLRSSETAQHIAAEIPLLSRRSSAESRLIENLAARILIAKKLQRHSRVYVRARTERNACGTESCANNINGRSRSCQYETVHRPAAEYCFGNLLRSRRWHLVGDPGGK